MTIPTRPRAIAQAITRGRARELLVHGLVEVTARYGKRIELGVVPRKLRTIRRRRRAQRQARRITRLHAK